HIPTPTSILFPYTTLFRSLASIDAHWTSSGWLKVELPSFAALLLLWQAIAMLIGDPVLLPTPLATLAAGYQHLINGDLLLNLGADRKSTRLNSSHVKISYA